MKPEITSREAILAACRRITATRGLPAVSMRAVATEAHVALGTLYHYFSDKDELLIAAVESVWQDILRLNGPEEAPPGFPDCVAGLYRRARTGAASYPGFLTAHSVILAGARSEEARQAMARVFEQLREGLLSALQHDPQVRPDAFGPAFTPDALTELVLDNVLLLLIREAEDCTPLTGLLRAALYPRP